MKKVLFTVFMAATVAGPAQGQSFLANVSALTPSGNRFLTAFLGETATARRFSQELLKDPANASARARLLELVETQVRTGRHLRLSRADFVLVLNMGLGWNAALGPDTQPYVHDFVRDMRSLEVKTAFLEKDPHGSIPDNVRAITPALSAELSGDQAVLLLSLCKGTPELISALKEVLAPRLTADRRQSAGPRVVSYLNLSGMLTGAFYSDLMGDSWLLRKAGEWMLKSDNLDVKINGKGALAAPSMRTQVVEPIVAEALAGLPSDIFYLSVVGAPTDREFLKNESALGPFFQLNDRLRIFKAANDGFLDITKVAFPPSVGENRAVVTLNASHVLSDGSFGPYKMTDEFVRRAVYRALVQLAIERGVWESR